MNNFTKENLINGGSINFLNLPSELTGGTGITNPSIFIDNEKLYCNIRGVQYMLYHSENEQKYQNIWGCLAYLNPEDDITLRTTNYLCELDKNTLEVISFQKVDTSTLDKEPLWEFIGLEDVRVVKWLNKFYYCGVRRDVKTNGEGRMEMSEIVNYKEVSRNRIEPPISSYCEKNWMPIVDLPFHFIKWSNPLEIVKVDLKTNTSKTIFTGEKHSLDRDLRGGSQVIRYNGYYIAITHEVDLWFNEKNNKDAQYYHRFLVWDENWNLISKSESFKFFDANIEFSCGLGKLKNELIITFGFQDTTGFVIKVKNSFFEKFLKLNVNKTPNEVVNTYTPKILSEFCLNTKSELTNYKLAEYYFIRKNYASALSFYLRTAEYGSTTDLIYESLLKVAICISKVGKRPTSEKSAFNTAIAFQPQRPEGYYFLSLFHEFRKEWTDSYTMASISLSLAHNITPIMGIDFYNSYQLLFQKAVASWWVGKGKESRELFFDLAHNRSSEMNDYYKQLVQNNITSLGSSSDPYLPYTKLLHEKLMFKFEGSDKITNNNSQTYQDMFVLTMLNGKNNGTYVEIGSADAFKGNNTALLERDFNWKGASIEILEYQVNHFAANRKNPVYMLDATKVNYEEFLLSLNMGYVFDYLQIDCEPPSTTYEILKMIPFDKFNFAVITFEHDYYADITKSYRDKSREYLKSKGYVLVVSNVSPNDSCPYEDWWVHPKYIDSQILEKMINADDRIKHAEKYMLGHYN